MADNAKVDQNLEEIFFGAHTYEELLKIKQEVSIPLFIFIHNPVSEQVSSF